MELVRREVGICCIQEVRWRRMGSKSVGSSGRRFKLWWSGNEDKIGGVGILVKEDLCMNVVAIYKKKGSVMDCASYRGVKLLEHGMEVVERLLEKRLRRLVKVDQMQFGFMPSRSTVDAIFILRRMQESNLEKNSKLFICFVDLEKAFDRVPRKVIEWALRKKLVPERLVQAVMSIKKEQKRGLRLEVDIRKNLMLV